MTTVTGYWRPTSVAAAFELLERPGAIAMGGGTTINASPRSEPVEVVDLQSVGLAGIGPAPDGTLVVGATTRLAELFESGHVPAVVREAARRERPNTLRAQATVGGCIARADAHSELLAALLVHNTVVRLGGREGAETLPLETVLARAPLPSHRLILSITLRTNGRAASARTARTPADTAIVAAYARSTSADGDVDGPALRLALTGVATTPVVVADLAAVETLDPPGDFLGSPEYRRSLAAILLARTVEALS
ncbi:MAG TPA: FAD binding domain-containing protein [Acidimicrobiales bacterium]|nr:FAD binding domain-containing protein [Acidimicrobiales bacterium]